MKLLCFYYQSIIHGQKCSLSRLRGVFLTEYIFPLWTYIDLKAFLSLQSILGCFISVRFFVCLFFHEIYCPMTFWSLHEISWPGISYLTAHLKSVETSSSSTRKTIVKKLESVKDNIRKQIKMKDILLASLKYNWVTN